MAKTSQTKAKNLSVDFPKKSTWEHPYFFHWLFFLFVFFLYANSIPNGYNMDDELVTINHRLTERGIEAIPEIFTSPYYVDANGYSYEYRPLVLVSFAIEHQFFGDNAHVSHFFNVLLYALMCQVLYVVLKRLFADYNPLIAVTITLLFIAHPAHTEVVCSIKNRDEILSLLFSLLSFFAVLKAVQGSNKWWILLVPVFFMMALLSKLSAVSFAVLIPLALLFFTTISSSMLILISFLLTTCFFFFPSNMSGYDKWIFSSGILLSSILFCVLFRKKILIEFKKLLAFSFQSTNFKIAEVSEKVLPSISFEGIFPDSSFFRLKVALPFICLIAVAVGCIIFQIGVGIIGIAIFFLIVFFRKEKAFQWWANMGFQILFMFCLFWFRIGEHIEYRQIFQTILAFMILYGVRSFVLPLFFSLIAIFACCFYSQSWSEFLFLPFCIFTFLSPYYRRGWIFAMVNGLCFLFALILSIFTNSSLFLSASNLSILLILILILVLYFTKWHKALANLFIIFFFLLFVKFGLDSRFEIISKPQIIDFLNKNKPQLIKYKQNRTFEYPENVIDNQTPLDIKAGTSLIILGHYLEKVMMPYPLSFYYGYSFIAPSKVSEPLPILILLLYSTIFTVAFVFYKKQPILSFGFFVYLFSISVFSNFTLQVPGMLADRFLLIPSVGWCIVVVVLITLLSGFQITKKEILKAEIKTLGKWSFLALLVFYSILSFARNSYWKDHISLFRHDISYVENSAQAHNLLALRLMKNSYDSLPSQTLSMRQEALAHFKKAKEIYPFFFNVTYDIARTYNLLNMTDSAAEAYRQTLKIDPNFTDASTALGELLMQQNKPEEALQYFQKLIEQFPDNYFGYDKVSFIYFILNKDQKAIAVNKQALLKMPTNPQPCITLAKIYHQMKLEDSTRVWLQNALKRDPQNTEALGLLRDIK